MVWVPAYIRVHCTIAAIVGGDKYPAISKSRLAENRIRVVQIQQSSRISE